MDYQDARTIFFTPSPPGTVEPDAVRLGGPARRLRDAIEPIAMHAVWCARTNDELATAYGLDFLGSYVWGRASGLGDAAPGVVVAAFAVFEPRLVTGVYEAARAKASWPDLVATRERVTAESLREILGDADVSGATSVLRRGIDAADRSGRPLFAGLSSQAWPSDPYGQLWRACDILREHRGDSHIATCVAAGLDAVEMNLLTELWLGMALFSYSATRGWSREQLGAAVERLRRQGLLDGESLSAEGLALRTTLEAQTDAAQRCVIDAIGTDLEPTVAQLGQWSGALVAAGAFPPSVHKRAAG